MRYTLPGFVYSVGLSPVISAAALTALELARAETWRVDRLRANSELFVELAREAGLDTGPAIGRGVVPILFRDSLATLHASRHLLANGFYAPPIIQIGVPKDQPRLRFFLSAAHTEAEIHGVIETLAALRVADGVADDVEARIAATAMADADLSGGALADAGLAGPDLASADFANADFAKAAFANAALAGAVLAANARSGGGPERFDPSSRHARAREQMGAAS
jgi:hypothetical protein